MREKMNSRFFKKKKLLKSKALYSTDIFNETMTINKFQMSRLTLYLSAEVTHIRFPPMY